MKIDLNKGVYIEIGGELGKNNSIPIDSLIKFAQDFQNLLFNIAKYDLPLDEAIDLVNFKIELTDFKKGSALPQFAFSRMTEETIGNTLLEHRNKVSQRFEQLIDISDKGDYTKLRDLYPEPFKRNIIINGLYSFVNDFGKSPVAFVDFVEEKKEILTHYKINRFKPEIKKELLSEISEQEILIAEEGSAFAKVKLTKTREGKMRKKITQLYTQKNISLNYAPEVIETENKKYILKFPLRCFFEKDEDYYVIQSEMLDIIGTGQTEDEAAENFAQEFDFIYNRYNEFADDKLSNHLRLVKSILNQIIDTIEVL